VLLTLGLGYGQRSDACEFCSAPENTESFTAHLALGKALAKGFGVGFDVSVWQRSHPGPLLPAEGEEPPAATPLVNRLGNLSVVLSYQAWRAFVRGGAGIAIGRQDFEDTPGAEASTVLSATGMGVGYTVGGGLTLPVHSLISLAVFANWNSGTYDLSSPHGILGRQAEHEYFELGFGISTR